MKMFLVCVLMSLVSGVFFCGGLFASESGSGYRDFVTKDREEFEAFRSGKSPVDKVREQVSYSRDISLERKRAMEIYSEFCELNCRLDDPKNGYEQRIKKLRNHLFPTGRAWYWEWPLWSDNDNDFKYPFLQELEVRAKKIRIERAKLVKAWNDEGFRSKLGHRSLDDCYGRKTLYFYLDKSVYPPALRTNKVDYVISHIDEEWPIETVATVASDSVPSAPPDAVIYEKPPKPEPPPAEVSEIDETVHEENVERMKPWDDMTPEERHQALLENRPEAWQGLSRDLHRDLCGTDTNGVPLVKAVLSCSNVVAVSTNIAIANLPPPEPIVSEKSWDDMTPQERHESIKNLKPVAWDAMHDALLSGNHSRIKDVIKALDAKSEITDAIRAGRYWYGYDVGVYVTSMQNRSDSPVESERIINNNNPASGHIMSAAEKLKKYEGALAREKIEELKDLIRRGYSDGCAGATPLYRSPHTGGLMGF